MKQCAHESCGRDHRIWLPSKIGDLNNLSNIGLGNHSENVLHSYCVYCGTVKNVSDDRPRKIGYWMNVLSVICSNHSVSNVQKRLIVKDLENYCFFDDLYGSNFSSQRNVFIKTVKKYVTIHEKIIDSFIY